MKLLVSILLIIILTCGALVIANPDVSLNDIILHEHTFTDEVVAPTCKMVGYTHHQCTECGYQMIDSLTMIDPEAHLWDGVDFVDSTCSKAGYKMYTCQHCNEQKVEEMPTTDHKFSEWANIKAPTCSEEGLDERICMECEFIESRAVSLLDHIWNEGVITEPTCVLAGQIVYTCTVCSGTMSEEIAALGHTWGEGVVIEPTCLAEGHTDYTCTACPEVKSEDITAIVDHKFNDWFVSIPSTCTVKGEERRDCEFCDHYETREIDIHNLVIDQAEATCTTHGYVSTTCSDCDYHTVIYTEPLGHSYGEWTDADGYTDLEQRECSLCGDKEFRNKE